MRRFIGFALVVVLIASSVASASATDYAAPSLFVSGGQVVFNGEWPIRRDNRVLVPIESWIFTTVGAETAYDIVNREIVIRSDLHILTSYLGDSMWYDNGFTFYESDVSSSFVNGQVYVPLRAVMESLGKTVTFDAKTFSVYIS
jgi:hypothetical protein